MSSESNVVSTNSSSNTDSKPLYPRCPKSWFLFGKASSFSTHGNAPAKLEFNGLTLIGFRDTTGKPVVMAARCSHFGSDLSCGEVVNGEIQCGYHGWRFNGHGKCCHISGCSNIPNWAKQRTYQAVERFGQVFFFWGESPLFEFPEFDEIPYTALVPSSGFRYVLNCPWYMIGANGFDMQHFLCAHDRELCCPPNISAFGKFCKKVELHSKVVSNSLRDRLIRRVLGDRTHLICNCWGGNIIIVKSTVGSSTTYAIGVVSPLGSNKCQYDGFIFMPRHGNGLMRRCLDKMILALKRNFVRAFLQQDVPILAQTYGAIDHCVTGLDDNLKEFLLWISDMSKITPTNLEKLDE